MIFAILKHTICYTHPHNYKSKYYPFFFLRRKPGRLVLSFLSHTYKFCKADNDVLCNAAQGLMMTIIHLCSSDENLLYNTLFCIIYIYAHKNNKEGLYAALMIIFNDHPSFQTNGRSVHSFMGFSSNMITYLTFSNEFGVFVLMVVVFSS